MSGMVERRVKVDSSASRNFVSAGGLSMARYVLVQRKSEFWPAVLSWLSGVVTTNVWEDEAPTAAHPHGNIKTMRPALVKELPYGIPP
jgi:hypothetical protein